MTRSRFVAAVAVSIVLGLALAAGPAFADDAPPPPHSDVGYFVFGGLTVAALVLFSWLTLRRIVTRASSRRHEEPDEAKKTAKYPAPRQ